MPDDSRNAALAKRDLTLDLMRVVCLLVVVAAHVCFVALRQTPDGTMENWTPPQELPFFAAGTWFIQPMPLFFVVGGCVSYLAWRSAQRRGDDAFTFFRARLVRFAQPAAALFVILSVVFGAAVLIGVPRSLADAASYGVGTPIWFMGAYLLCQALIPPLAAAHRRHPVVPLVVLALGAVVVDVARMISGVELVGLLNYLFAWPFAQQLGFWLADHRLDRFRRWQLLLAWAVSMALTGVMASLASYGPDMLQNQIPPTAPLVTMAIGHTCLFVLVRPGLRRLVQHKAVLGIMYVIGSRAMTIYLWHAAFVIGIAALFFFIPGLPQAPSAAWWLTRIPVLAVVLALVLAVSVPLVKLERGPDPSSLPRTGTLGVRLLIVVAGVLAVFPAFRTTVPSGDGKLEGLDFDLLLIGAAMLVLALVLLRLGPRRVPESESGSAEPSHR